MWFQLQTLLLFGHTILSRAIAGISYLLMRDAISPKMKKLARAMMFLALTAASLTLLVALALLTGFGR